MILRKSAVRSGITLTEILISILIMGVGLISLATLFPLGLLRLRDAQRQSRSGLLSNTANADIDAQSLLYKPSFTQSWYSPIQGANHVNFDPFIEDTWPPNDAPGNYLTPRNASGTILAIPGLPFCYDPLWRAVAVVPPSTGLVSSSLNFPAGYTNNANEARFGCGNPRVGNSFVPFVRAVSGAPSAYGLPRLTNFIPWTPNNAAARWNFTCGNPFLAANAQPIDVAGLTFASQDDILFYKEDENTIISVPSGSGPVAVPVGRTSPLIPELDPSTNRTIQDYRFTWFITGRQIDSTNAKTFEGEIVVCENRPFALESLLSPISGNSAPIAAGETVVDAIFGYGSSVGGNIPGNGLGYAVGGDRTVLLRWPTTLPDPEIKVGSWIADVTYERNLSVAGGPNVDAFPPTSTTQYSLMFNAGGPVYPSQRCNWYQIVKRTDAQDEDASTQPPVQPGYRRIVVTVNSPVKAKTLLNRPAATPVWNNAALIMPSVINVFPRTFHIPG